jgi:hypothetical protein
MHLVEGRPSIPLVLHRPKETNGIPKSAATIKSEIQKNILIFEPTSSLFGNPILGTLYFCTAYIK